MMSILFCKEAGSDPYHLAYDPETMGEADMEAMTALVECIYPQSFVVTIHHNEKMVAIYSRRTRGWTMHVPDGTVGTGFRHVVNVIRGANPVFS